MLDAAASKVAQVTRRRRFDAGGIDDPPCPGAFQVPDHPRVSQLPDGSKGAQHDDDGLRRRSRWPRWTGAGAASRRTRDDRSCTPHRNGAPDLRRVGVALGALTLAVALLVTVAVVRPAGGPTTTVTGQGARAHRQGHQRWRDPLHRHPLRRSRHQPDPLHRRPLPGGAPWPRRQRHERWRHPLHRHPLPVGPGSPRQDARPRPWPARDPRVEMNPGATPIA